MTTRNDKPYVPITNPYIVGNPVADKKMFFGREENFQYVSTKFADADQGGMIVFCGNRRSGKTSILFQINQGRLGSGFLPVLVDMQAVTPDGDQDFVRMLARKIREAAGDRAPDVRFAPAGDGWAEVREAFLTFRRELWSGLGEVSIIVMFDEYELFETNIDDGALTTRVLDLLGEAIQGSEGLFLLFAGSEKLEERKADYWSSSLGGSLFQNVSYLKPGDALRLIHDPVAGEVGYEDGVSDRILELGGRHPFYTQVICLSLIDHLNDCESRRAGREDLETVVQEVIENPLPQMAFTWSSFTDPEKVAVSCLSELNREESQWRTAQEILDFLKREKIGITLAGDTLSEALERLFSKHDFLYKEEKKKEGDEERFRFRMDLWRLWIGRMHSIWQAKDEIFAKGRKHDPGVIHLARRRLKRLSIALSVVIVGAAAYYLKPIIIPPTPLEIAPPDSSYVHVTMTPADARFFLGNTELTDYVGQDSIRVPADTFAYRVEKDGYRTVTDSVILLKDELTPIAVNLAELTGGLLIESTPPGATVTVDEVTQGEKAPLRLTGLSAQRLYKIRFVLDQYNPHTYNNVQILPDSIVPLRHNFSRRTHPLAITTRPDNALIRFDDREIGRAPQTQPRVSEGNHTVTARLRGYFDESRTVEVPVAGNQIELTLRRHPKGQLVLSSYPFADIYVNGGLVASESMSHTEDLYEGLYEVEFKHPTLDDRTYTVRVGPDSTSTQDNNFMEQR